MGITAFEPPTSDGYYILDVLENHHMPSDAKDSYLSGYRCQDIVITDTLKIFTLLWLTHSPC